MENKIDKAVVALAAKGITDKLNKHMESILKLEVNDVMPLVDKVRTQFGPKQAEALAAAYNDAFNNIKQVLLDTKMSLGENIDKLTDAVEGTTDMASYVAPADEATSSEVGGDDSVGDQVVGASAPVDAPVESEVAVEDQYVADEGSLTATAERNAVETDGVLEISDDQIIEAVKSLMSQGSSAVDSMKKVATTLEIDLSDVMDAVSRFVEKKN